MPKVRRFSWVVDGSPAEVAERLRARSRFRLFPHQASFLGRGGLGGRVDAGGFRLALDDRSWLQWSQAVAVGTLTEVSPGRTRIEGDASLPRWVTWWLRLVVLILPLVMGGVALTLAQGSVGIELAAFLAYTLAVLAGSTVAIGVHVSNADAQVEPLLERLGGVVGASAEAAGVARPVGRREVE